MTLQVTLYMAISLDGKTTDSKGDTSWVQASDVERMDKEMIDSGVMIMGNRTYESFGDELPVGKALMIIMTNDPKLISQSNEIMATLN